MFFWLKEILMGGSLYIITAILGVIGVIFLKEKILSFVMLIERWIIY